MINYINDLKTKPEHIRKRFAFTFSFVFTFIIFTGWMASYLIPSNSPILAKNNIEKDNKENINAIINIESPVSSLTASAITVWKDIKSIFLNSNKIEFSNDNIEVTAGKR